MAQGGRVLGNAPVYIVVLLGFALMVIAPGFITWILMGLALGLVLPGWYRERFK